MGKKSFLRGMIMSMNLVDCCVFERAKSKEYWIGTETFLFHLFLRTA